MSRFLQRRAPCSEGSRDRYIEDKLTDTISANIAPTPQDALPCVFLSAVAGPRGWLLLTSASGARDLGKQDAAGSRLDPAARRGGGGCTIKTSNAGEEDKQTRSFQCGPSLGRVGAPGPGLALVPAAVLADVRAPGGQHPSYCFPPGLGPGPGTRPPPVWGHRPAGQVEDGQGALWSHKPLPRGPAGYLAACCLPPASCLSFLTGTKNKPWVVEWPRSGQGRRRWCPAYFAGWGRHPSNPRQLSAVEKKQPFSSFKRGIFLISTK